MGGFSFQKMREFFLRKYKKHFQSKLFTKYFGGWSQKVQGAFWENIIKPFFWENITNIFRGGFSGNFFREKFWGVRSKIALGSYFCKRFHHRCLTVFWICLRFWMYQDSDYARVLNIPSSKESCVSWKLEGFLEKI